MESSWTVGDTKLETWKSEQRAAEKQIKQGGRRAEVSGSSETEECVSKDRPVFYTLRSGNPGEKAYSAKNIHKKLKR